MATLEKREKEKCATKRQRYSVPRKRHGSAFFSALLAFFIVAAATPLMSLSPGLSLLKPALASSVVSTISLSDYTTDAAMDVSNNVLYVGTVEALASFNGANNQAGLALPTGLGTPYNAVVDSASHRAFVSSGLSGYFSVLDLAVPTIIKTLSIGAYTGGIAYNPNTNKIYLTSYDAENRGNVPNRIIVIDGSTYAIVANVTVPAGGSGIAVNPATNMIYATNLYTNNVSVINGATNAVVATISVGSVPYSAAVNPQTNRVYVTNLHSNSVSVIDGATNAVIATVLVDVSPDDVKVNSQTNTIYVLNSNLGLPGAVSVIDGKTNTVTETIPVGVYPGKMALDTATNRLYVPAQEAVSVIDISASASSQQPYLTVNTVASDGTPIYGYYTILSQGGNTVATSFSTATFTVNSSQTYTVTVSDFGGYYFDHWQDTGSTSKDRSVSITANSQITAVYRNTNAPPPSGQATLQISTSDTSNNPIFGYYTALYQNGVEINSGFSPIKFAINTGQTYQVSVSDYGSYFFSNWQDTGNSTRLRTVTIPSSASDGTISLTAAYSTSPPNSCTSTFSCPPPPTGQSIILVDSIDITGAPLPGYYTTLWQNSALQQSQFTHADFRVGNMQTFQVAVADYGSHAFDHWSDGTKDRYHTVTTGNGTTTSLIAVYQ